MHNKGTNNLGEIPREWEWESKSGCIIDSYGTTTLLIKIRLILPSIFYLI